MAHTADHNLAIGVGYLVVLLLTRPARITETKRAFVES